MGTRRKLNDHPRLYLDGHAVERCRREPKTEFLRHCRQQVEREAKLYLRSRRVDYPAGHHNAFLLRARSMQREVGTLLARWAQTGSEAYRRAVLERVHRMGEWEYWSWIAWRDGKSERSAVFDLSYGENSATLALAYDWLHDSLSASEKKEIIDIARAWSFASGKVHCRPGGAWWFGRPDSNWNTVCAGGLGMLCLAMFEDVGEARKLVANVEQSVRPFMDTLEQTGGGWPEGIGYWRYGMYYAFMYLLSWENATGRVHPLLRRKSTRRTLQFPLDFCPHGHGCGFGDSNRWAPSPFHYAVAKRLGATEVMMALDQRMAEQPAIEPTWSEPAEWLAVHPDKGRPPRKRTVVGGVRLYKGLDWAILADNFASPTIYASVRGGTTRVPHGQRDLLSFHVVVGDEQLVTHLRGGEYMDSTFSPRRNEIPEMMPNTKNTILINGVGITVGSELDRTQEIHGPGIEGVRLVATGAMGMIRQGHAAAEFCGRALLLLDRRALLVLDRIVLPFAGRAESRLHTYADAKLRAKTARIRGRKQSLRVTYAADVAAVLTSACPAPSLAAEPAPTMLRWCSTDRADKTFTLATLMLPGASPATLRVGGEGAHIVVHAARGKWRKTIRLTRTLRLA